MERGPLGLNKSFFLTNIIQKLKRDRHFSGIEKFDLKA